MGDLGLDGRLESKVRALLTLCSGFCHMSDC